MSRLNRLIHGEIPIGYVLYKICSKRSSLRCSRMVRAVCYGEEQILKTKLIDDIKEMKIETYDGFDQANHPDIIRYGEKYVLVVTPYTFSDENVENPCLYISETGYEFIPVGKHPIISKPIRECRNHLSDPALRIDSNNILNLYYRECVHVIGEDRKDIIFRIRSEDLINWTNPEIIYHEDNCLIAPSFCSWNGHDYVFYVKEENNNTMLYRAEERGSAFINECQVEICNEPDQLQIWHVDIKKHTKESFFGLFTYMEKPGSGKSKLFVAKSPDAISWEICEEILLKPISAILNIYKATSYVQNNKVVLLISACDKHQRWKVYSSIYEEKNK